MSAWFLDSELSTCSSYGVDCDGPPPLDVDDHEVVVPEIPCPISASRMIELQSLYDPLSPCDDFTVTLYHNVLQFVQNQI